MSEERQKLKEKQFLSLNRSWKRKIGNGPTPINNLISSNEKSANKQASPKVVKEHRFSPDEAIKTSEKLRAQITTELDSTPTKRSGRYKFTREKPQKSIDDIFLFPQEDSKVSTHMLTLRIISLDYNGETKRAQNRFELLISLEGNRITFKNSETIIDDLEIKRDENFDIMYFGFHSILILLSCETEYVFIRYLDDDRDIWDQLKKNKWNVKNVRLSSEELLTKKNEILKKRAKSGQEQTKEQTNENSSEKSAKRGVINAITPEEMYEGRQTRSQSKEAGINCAHPISVEESKETPPGFEPPLKHLFAHNRVFTVTYSDFKTLFNTDWINDTIIDFFIKFEVEEAIYKKNLFKENEIYAFNSFFFTKLMETQDNQDVPSHYQNVKKWLNKIEIMKYSSVIIPINENAHWYCCIIRGLPELLKAVKVEAQKSIHVEAEQLLKDSEINKLEPSDNSFEGNAETETLDAEKSGMKTLTRIARAEIFIFDSLGQRHTNIHYPLKDFLIDYCKDKYSIEIKRDRLRIQNAKVPRQNNFNDCGIHVIYNVKKWLSNTRECEKLWRKFQLKQRSRSFFLAEERNKMRKELINILLDLHKTQVESAESAPQNINENESDDEVEVIEFDPLQEKYEIPTKDLISSEPALNLCSSSEPGRREECKRTLDPKASSSYSLNHATSLKNDSLLEIIDESRLQPEVRDLLDKVFPKKNGKLENSQKSLALQLVEEAEKLKEKKENNRINELISAYQGKFNSLALNSHSIRPRHQTFRILYDKGVTSAVDISDSEEVNQDLSQLQLSDGSTSHTLSLVLYDRFINSSLDSPKVAKLPKSSSNSLEDNIKASNLPLLVSNSSKRRKVG
ncbi:uncharacterized protein PRCAT00000192001 [Priceomyces carsonii]|uniref:uncharacterized protein n=1 Tax=Priceomyces carsonii TaxID=28549 RepID=UPI002ED7AD0D|nr:unnamed protein product [Priceomyces carsonii]